VYRGMTQIQKRKDGHLIRFDAATSARMGRVRRHDTKPERIVRSLLHAAGHRFRIENRDLPGSPDIANRRARWAVFVHGCYWHRHSGCAAATTPKRNREFWLAKFRRNVERDEARANELRALGFRVIVVWECQTKRELGRLNEMLLRDLRRSG